jgi:hypothetical protein
MNNKRISKAIMIVPIMLSVMSGLVSCSSMESDAKRMAKLAYQTQMNYENNTGKDADSRKAVEFGNKMLEKYGKDEQTKEKFTKLVDMEIAKRKKNNKD